MTAPFSTDVRAAEKNVLLQRTLSTGETYSLYCRHTQGEG